MKLIFTEYLASLKERGELDVVLPDLLSELGWLVLSRPAIGTRQFGVDVAAVGLDDEGARKIFLISIKPGDLTRSDWNRNNQSLRPSLEQIVDVYIPTHMPKRYRDLPVVVVLCVGGELREEVRLDVVGYIERYTSERISFRIWNGDTLANLLLSGVLRENALPATWRSDYRKSVALVDEPDVSYRHYCSFVSAVADAAKQTRPARLTALRQIYIGLWTLFVWARNADNTEAAYLCSEYAILVGWSLIKDHGKGKSKAAGQIRHTFDRLIVLYRVIADDYIERYVKPRAKVLHGLSTSVPSHSYLDVNLKMFDVIGRVGMQGIWNCDLASRVARDGSKEAKESVRSAIERTAELLEDIVRNNPVLCTPIKDEQAIDINIACLFLSRVGHKALITQWIGQIARATIYAFHAHDAYPCVHREYRYLVEHPKKSDEYRAKVTVGSVLIPTLGMWAAINGDVDTLGVLADFVSGPYRHSNLQLLYPGADTEEHLYRGSADHGLAAGGIEIARSCEDMIAPIRAECAASAEFRSLSAIAWGLWQLVTLACRHYRVPVPPHFWPIHDASGDGG